MNTVFLKIAGGVLLLFVVLIVVASLFSSSKESENPEDSSGLEESKPVNKTIYDVMEEDKKKYAIPAETSPEPPVAPSQSETLSTAPAPMATPAKPTIIYVKPLGEIEDIQAQRLFSVVVPGKSIGRMRAGYNLTVQNAKQIIQSYPESKYAFQAKRVLADIPERYRRNYHLTDKLLDISMFFKKRPGTQPMQVQLDD